MGIVDEDQAFNHQPRVTEAPIDPPPRLRGDILVWQVIDAYTPSWLSDGLSIGWGVLRTVCWELPKVLVEAFVIEPWKRWRK